MDKTSLERDWLKAFGALTDNGSMDAFLAFFNRTAFFIDEDSPFIMDLSQFTDHMSFHGSGIWEKLDWKPRDYSMHVFGSTGFIAGNFTLRGKPVNAGFRQRHGVFTVNCAYNAATRSWNGLGLHFSPMLSHTHSNSPT